MPKRADIFDEDALGRVLFAELGFARRAEFAVAYSGGGDSQALLHAMWRLRSQVDFSLRALHFDHGLAAESAHWARHCEAYCGERDIPYASTRQVVVKTPGISTEALARRSRYAWFQRALAPGQILLTAHHADDQAESVLLGLLRGGGPHALAGIPVVRVLSAAHATQVARPLLSFSRPAVADYARRQQLRWVEDPSNQAEEFDRNFIRHSVMPTLRQRWPGAVGSLIAAADNGRDAAGFISEACEALLPRCQAADKIGVFCLAPPLDIRAMTALGQFQRSALLRHWIHRHGQPSPSRRQLATLAQQVFVTAGSAASRSAAVRWKNLQLRRFRDHLYLLRPADAPLEAAMDWDLQPRQLGGGLRIEVCAAADGELDAARLRGRRLQLVWRRGGERMRRRGRDHSHALKKLFQQHAVPVWERDALPLLVADGDIAWAPGVGAGAAYCRADGGDGDGDGIRIRFTRLDSYSSRPPH